MSQRAVVIVRFPAPGQAQVVTFAPESPQPRPHDVNKLDGWLNAGWRLHSAGGVAIHQPAPPQGAIAYITALNLEHD
jgi:hypothetical protein